ncbi:DUF4352 domain-containing protein [Actinoplanes sp. CA-030573]|uniref:DUF4352 domain-containing protein n=1 Tax=Actinoplanes sp. CA-030573 TaxID=3239898 RepID=UPI003D8E77DF
MTHDPVPRRRPAPLNPLLAALLACGAVAVLFVAGVLASRHGPGREPAAADVPARPASPEAPRAPEPGIGDPVRDGKFEFVVSRVDCSRTTVGVEHLTRTAKGKFCVVSLSVRNIAGGSRYFIGRAQKALDSSGVSYRDDDIAGIYANHDTQTFLDRVTPGERVTGQLVFDVPRSVTLTSLELHDSPLSGGAEVTLSHFSR